MTCVCKEIDGGDIELCGAHNSHFCRWRDAAEARIESNWAYNLDAVARERDAALIALARYIIDGALPGPGNPR